MTNLDKIAIILGIEHIEALPEITIQITAEQMWEKASVLAEWLEAEFSDKIEVKVL